MGSGDESIRLLYSRFGRKIIIPSVPFSLFASPAKREEEMPIKYYLTAAPFSEYSLPDDLILKIGRLNQA
jgi:hypothetical protein